MVANKEFDGLGESKDDSIQAVIFDMDGVLIDSEPIYFEIERSSFAHFGAKMTEEEHHTYVGVTLESMWRQVLDKHQLTATVEEALAYHQHNVMQTMLAHPKLTAIPSVERWLSWLHEQHIPIAVASSSPRALIDLIMDKTGLGKYFEVRMTGEEVTNGKPAPDIFLTTAEMIGASPSNCLVIEDSRNGVQAAKSAGMRCIGYRNPGSGDQDLSKADLQISNYDELWTLKDTLPLEGRSPSLSEIN
ncbi:MULTISPECIES: HAD family hydrolase [unclassified Paenibacillus]|uniref:HAD family hydrolase n=1 Tax=unclassified Paenibacillus TaxID=185978 RepID=UPI0009A561E7|nr:MULTISPECIES: HAD family hydrolase [unclassified Paenibacillus]SLJ90252.1 haloacid dehalogenase superfamily, subfamily IA, variant 3 with third motif having DD or ED/beta-phosphoglucomutase family hydrolase [Paenibacillus sp. RU5A]SOC59049.1 haloacid dehalogenase superfamily, subfamily IA, variant 3 with third motif having DD or ED/beta-phosphoglucomutase family hydrolase [Paenibacillus sp. RU26A]SOC68100.1 haloacid dehalogenase superfamily, subfamily IA, variant 3 with third motif having DD 